MTRSVTPTQLPLLLDDAHDWTAADGWSERTLIHACAQRLGADVRWYLGDGPRDETHGIHAAGCHYRRADNMNFEVTR